MVKYFEKQQAVCLLVVFNMIGLASTTLLNYEPDYEYLYHMNSTIELKSVQRFNLRALIGFVNIAENRSHQELVLLVHKATFRLQDQSDMNGLQTHDMSKWFSFDISRRGEINAVYYQVNEDEEVIRLKKGFAGLLSAKLFHLDEIKREEDMNEWNYNTNELGNEGHHNATYKVTATQTGYEYRKKRTSSPLHEVIGTSVYDKTIQFHNQLKTVNHVTVNETYSMNFSEKYGFDPFYASRPVRPVTDFEHIELPTIEASSYDKLHFTEKRHFNANIQRPHKLVNDSIHHLVQTSFATKLKTEGDIQSAISYIAGNMTCIKQQPAEGSQNQTRCFHELVSNILKLPDEILENITDLYLADSKRNFQRFDALAFIDALGAVQSPLAQRLLLDRILSNPWSSTEFYQRALLAIVSMDAEPLLSIVKTLLRLCLKGKHPNGISLSEKSKHRTCLASGSLIGRLRKHGRVDEATEMVENFHSLLGVHDPWLYRRKRSTMSEQEILKHDLDTVIFLDTIGNAGMDSSFVYIISHINSSNSQWIKRSAIHALRRFHDTDTLRELEKAALYDEDETVRYEAMLQYQAHPLAKRSYDKGENSIRNARHILENVLKYKLEAPGVDWRKILGSRNIGASFGVIMENMLDLEFSPLKGTVDVRVHDEVYTRVHIGYLGINLDFFSARLCFKGGVKYDINIIQEVDRNLFQKRVRDFKSISQKIVQKAKVGIEAFKTVLNDFSFTNAVDGIITSIQEIPTKVLTLGSKVRQIMEKLSCFDLEKLPSFIQPVKKFVDAVTSLYDRIREDVMTFYNSIIEATTIIIPHAAEQIFESVQGVIRGLMKIFKDPKTALSDIGRGVILVYANVKQLDDTKNEIMKHTFITDGLKSYWTELTEDVINLRDLYDIAKHSLKTEGRQWVADVVEDNLVAKSTDGKVTLEKVKETIISELEADIQELLDPLFLLGDIGGEYLQRFTDLFDVFSDIKEAYTLFKNGYKAARSIVNGIFGHKFDKNFPRTRRVSGGGCTGGGFYPSELGGRNTEYRKKGIDVLASVGDDLVAPIAGTVLPSDDANEILIKGSNDLPEGSELFITNIKLTASIRHRTQVTAGEIIGKVLKSPCYRNNHIHVAIRRNGGYVDPSPYLADRVIEVPRWNQICDDYKLIFKFETISSGYAIGSEGRSKRNTTQPIPVDNTLASSEMDESKRPKQNRAEKSTIRKMESTTDCLTEYRKQHLETLKLYIDAPFEKAGLYYFAHDGRTVEKRFEIVSDQQLKECLVYDPKTWCAASVLDILVGDIHAFIQQFSIRRIKAGAILKFLDEFGLEDTKEEMAKLLTNIKESISNTNCRNPDRMTEQELQNELFNRGKQPKGTTNQMIKELTTVDKSCPLLSLALPDNELLYCTLDEKCLGLECCITVEMFDLLQKTLRFFIRLDLNPMTLTLGVKTWTYSIDQDSLLGEFEDSFDTGIEFDFLDGLRIIAKYSGKGTATELKLSFSIGICHSANIDDCLIDIPLLNNAVFPFPGIKQDGALHFEPINVTKYIEEIKTNVAGSPSDITEAVLDRTVEEVLNTIGIDKSLLLNRGACPRPQNFETSELKSHLEQRGLSSTGSREELNDRYVVSDMSCRMKNVTLTLPKLRNDNFYYFISEDCMRIDVCLDFYVSSMKFSRTFYAYLELDPCNFTFTAAFEKKTRQKLLFEYEWDKDEIIRLTDDINILVKINKNEEENVFVVDMDIKLNTIEETVLQGFQIPIPICNDEFALQGSLKDLATSLGGELSPAIFNLFLKQLKIDDIIHMTSCTLPAAPTACPNLDVSDVVPENMKDILRCVYAENCFGVACCAELSLPIPMSSQQIDAEFPVWFEFDPCNFNVNYGIGDRSFKEPLLHYSWGSEEVVPIGSPPGKDAPIKLKYTVGKMSNGFIIDMAVEICLPVDDERICVPRDGIVLLNQQEIPVCEPKGWIEFTNFSLHEWITSKGEDINKQLSNAGRDALIAYLRLKEFLLETPCDRKRIPYSPDINGWNNMCPMSFARIPRLQNSISCGVPDYCTRIDCCLDIEQIGLPIHAYLEINMCNYIVSIGIEKETYTFPLFGYEWGKTETITIKDFLLLRYSIKKPANEKTFIVTLEIAACFEKDRPCLPDIKVLDSTEVPQIGCNMSIDVSKFSISTWMQKNGLASMLPTYTRWGEFIEFMKEVTGLEKYLLDEECLINEDMHVDESNKLNNDLDDVDVSAYSSDASCRRTPDYSYTECCMRSEVLNRNLSMNFSFEPCEYRLNVNVENIKREINLLEYEWETRHTVSLIGLWVLRFMVTNVQSEKQFSVDLDLHLLVLDGNNETDISVIVANDLKIAYTSCPKDTNGLTNPYYEISHDFWKIPECTINETIVAVDTPIKGCHGLLQEIKDVCSLSSDCSGIKCCTVLDFGDAERNANLELTIDCDNNMQLRIENKLWERNLLDIPDVISFTVANCMTVDLVVQEHGQQYSVSMNVTVCTLSTDVIICDVNVMIPNQYLSKKQCLERKKREVIDIVNGKDDPDFKVIVRELMKRGATEDEIQQMFDNLIEDENRRKTEVWQDEPLSDSDTSTGYSATLRSLGHNNPETLKHQRGIFNTSIDVLGGDIIQSMFGSVTDVLHRANQLFVVGNGFSDEGIKLLGVQLASMTIGDIEAMLQVNKVDPLMVFQLVQDFIDLAKALYSELMERLVDRSTENAFETFDIILRGTIWFPKRNIYLFHGKKIIPIGPLWLFLGFGVQGYFGVDVGLEGKLIARTAACIVSPFGGLSAYGEAGIKVGLLEARLLLEGTVLDVSFPTRAEIAFSKFPLDVSLVMDLNLIPFRLQLGAEVTLKIKYLFGSFEITLIRKKLWEYLAPKVKKRVVDSRTIERDVTPPDMSQPVSFPEQGDNAVVTNQDCDVFQHRFRDYTEPEFSISVAVFEDRGPLRFFLDIGTVPGASDVENERQLGGPSTVQTTSLDEYPSGQPLYFTFHAENTAGARSSATCSLPTYDTTPPTGRISVDFLTTSNRHVIKATIIVHDDSEISDAFVAVGYGKGVYGDQVQRWISLNLNQKGYLANDDNPLSSFAQHQEGKLLSPPFQIYMNIHTASKCAELCLKIDVCVSFNFDYGESGQCDLLKSIRHYDESLVMSDLFSYFERLGTGHSTEIHYDIFNMSNNFLYFVNVDITNVLGYRSQIESAGIFTDFTPPQPGYISNVVSDRLKTSNCLDLIPSNRPDMRRFCVGLDNATLNHRMIIDGEGSLTVFNGDTPNQDKKYTRNTNYIAGNWNGIHDDETGIRAYTLSVGSSICGDEIHQHHDPNKHLIHESQRTQWTNIAVITPTTAYNPFPLPSGSYYLTVRAINRVEYGGPLALSVCHSTPYIIDNTKPIIYEIYNIRYDEDSNTLSGEHNSTDPESGLAFIEICLGNSQRSCGISQWKKYPTFSHFEHLVHIPDGNPAWLRLRVTNNVDLHVVGQADGAFTVDASKPFAGTVYDGLLLQEDLDFTNNSNRICANWNGFFDPESGISYYEVGIGSEPGLTDVAGPWRSTQHEQEHCFVLPENTVIHDHVYFVIVWAHNAAVMQQNVQSVSNGVRIDISPPHQGLVVDGNSKGFRDINFSSSKTDVYVQWKGFYDPESDIQHYDVQTLRKRANGDWDIIKDLLYIDKSTNQMRFGHVDLEHRDEVKSKVRATNGAQDVVEVETDGFLVDLTSPIAEYINDGENEFHDIEFQSDTSALTVSFKFYDAESALNILYLQIYEQSQGHTRQIFPEHNGEWTELSESNITQFKQSGLLLTSGRKYITRIRAINGAGLESTYESNGLIIDDSQPKIRWVNVGVLSGEEENVDGLVLQSDHNGIKVSWRATDPQSGISAVKYAVGSTAGSTDIIGWTLHKDSLSSVYIPCILEDTDQSIQQPLYYVTLVVLNGAGSWSDSQTSSPIIVVPQDVTGIVSDGSIQHVNGDIDYTTDAHTVSMHFTGFKSHQHGIETYVWATGTSPGAEDILPYTKQGIIYSEEEDEHGAGVASSGYAQIPLDLDQGQTYYTTLRARTTAGNILQATTDGFLVDTSPPVVALKRISNQPLDNISSIDAIYQYDQSSLATTWQYQEDETLQEDGEANIKMTWVSVGTYPLARDIYNLTYFNGTPTFEGSVAVPPATSGKTNIVSVGVKNKAGLTGIAISPPVTLDSTAPIPGEVTCPRFVQSQSNIICSWRGFNDKESQILKYNVIFGTKQGFDDIRASTELSGHTKRIFIENLLEGHGDIAFASVTAQNAVGLTATGYSAPIIVDLTPPIAGIVVDLPSLITVESNAIERNVRMNTVMCSTEEECFAIDATCIESLTRIGVAWIGFEDPESEILEYKISVGTTPGGAEIVPLFPVSPNINHFFITNIDIKGQRQLFTTVRATNVAQLSTEVHSNGVYISYISQGLPPLHHIGVYDSSPYSSGDIHFQTDTTSIEAKWDTSGDPCPVVQYEWSIETIDGIVLQDFVNMLTSTHGVNDRLELVEGRRYYSLVKVLNMMGHVYTLRSDGVTIDSNPVLPGIVYDGDITGHDLQVLPSNTTVTASWEGFGRLRIPSAIGNIQTGNNGLQSQLDKEFSHEIAYYEVALGTDRSFPDTRINIIPFTNVGLNTTVTFKHLDLLTEPAVYYFTVRAFSTSNTWATATSNGFEISFDSGVFIGKIEIPDFISTNKSIEVFWNGFKSNAGILAYYAAVSDHMNVIPGNCKRYVDGGKATDEEKSKTFNIYPVTSNGVNTYLKIEGLSLYQNKTYFIWIMGVDKSGECNMTLRHFTVDITPPEKGRVTAGPYFDMKLSFSNSMSSLPVKWDGFSDPESGINIFNISLWQRGNCSGHEQEHHSILIGSLHLSSNYTNFTLTDLDLKEETVYQVSIEAVNNGGLYSSVKTSPVIYDDSVPRSGHVFEGSNVAEDVVWWGYTDHMNGLLLHFPIGVDNTCPEKYVNMSDNDWISFEKELFEDPDELSWGIRHRSTNIQTNDVNDTCYITISRATTEDAVYSGAYTRPAEIGNGGHYKVSIKAADGGGLAVTGVTFWDGDYTELPIYDHQPRVWDEGTCGCCFETNNSACSCNCEDFLNNNQSRFFSDSNFTDSPSNISDNQADVNLAAQRACGLQIYSGSSPYVVSWCRVFNESWNVMSVSSELDFDPSGEYHDYMLDFISIREEINPTFCIRIYIDSKQKSELCGIPELSPTTKFVLHVWNKNNVLPPLEIFNLWEATASFRHVIMPPDIEALCRFGEPFQGGTNAIVKYEAAIGTSKEANDIVDFKEVITPCIPCSSECSRFDCEPDCASDTYSVLEFSLNNIHINETYDGSLYLTVKAVLGSGAAATSSSNGFYIDLSPPVFDRDAFFYIDVLQGNFTPTHFQGSDNTIMAVWLCVDDKNEIKEYKWAIGTSVGGEEVQPFTSTGTSPLSTNSYLKGILKHNTMYYVSVKCTNEAGITTTYMDETGVTVLTEKPDPNSVEAAAVNTFDFDRPVYPLTAQQSLNTTYCGLAWSKSEDTNLFRYDFCIGSSLENIDNIVPCTFVGYNSSGKIEIKHGYLYMNDTRYFSISELRVLSEGIHEASSEDSDNNFQMESGRTIFLFMRLCNKAELCSIKYVGSVLFTNERSALLTSEKGEPVNYVFVPLATRVKRELTYTELSVELPQGMKPGQSVLVNEITEDELEINYGSSASTVFTPYISNPYNTSENTQRILYNRINSFLVSFSISPVGQEPLPGALKITFPLKYLNTTTDEGNMMSQLTHWNPDVQQWQLSNKTCVRENETFTHNYTAQTTTVKICDTRGTRQEDSYLSQETHFALVFLRESITNSAPKIIEPMEIILKEDTADSQFLLLSIDSEGDDAAFDILQKVGYPFGNVSVEENGLIVIELCENCHGEAVVQILAYDIPEDSNILSEQSLYNITVHVLPVNDQPYISFYSLNGEYLLHEGPSGNIMVYKEQDVVISTAVGIVVVYDIDGPQDLKILLDQNGSNSFDLQNITKDTMIEKTGCKHDICSESNTEWRGAYIFYTQSNTTFIGEEKVKLVALDENGTYSDVITLAVIVEKKSAQVQEEESTDTLIAILVPTITIVLAAVIGVYIKCCRKNKVTPTDEQQNEMSYFPHTPDVVLMRYVSQATIGDILATEQDETPSGSLSQVKKSKDTHGDDKQNEMWNFSQRPDLGMMCALSQDTIGEIHATQEDETPIEVTRAPGSGSLSEVKLVNNKPPFSNIFGPTPVSD